MTTPTMSRAPRLVAKSHRSGRALVLPPHTFVYCEDECIAYAGPGGKYRRGTSVEVWRLTLHEFDCMTWHCVSADEFEHRLPLLAITTGQASKPVPVRA